MRGVGRGVRGIDAVPDHRRLMAHGVDAGQQPGQQLGVAHVAADQLVPAGVRRAGPVRLREQRVEQDRLVAAGREPVRDVRPDEPGPAGDQNPHGWTVVRVAPADRRGRRS